MAKANSREGSVPKVSINDVVRWAVKHEKETGEYLSYHQAVEAMRQEGYSV